MERALPQHVRISFVFHTIQESIISVLPLKAIARNSWYHINIKYSKTGEEYRTYEYKNNTSRFLEWHLTGGGSILVGNVLSLVSYGSKRALGRV